MHQIGVPISLSKPIIFRLLPEFFIFQTLKVFYEGHFKRKFDLFENLLKKYYFFYLKPSLVFRYKKFLDRMILEPFVILIVGYKNCQSTVIFHSKISLICTP